jgi:hypothetical protein
MDHLSILRESTPAPSPGFRPFEPEQPTSRQRSSRAWIVSFDASSATDRMVRSFLHSKYLSTVKFQDEKQIAQALSNAGYSRNYDSRQRRSGSRQLSGQNKQKVQRNDTGTFALGHSLVGFTRRDGVEIQKRPAGTCPA